MAAADCCCAVVMCLVLFTWREAFVPVSALEPIGYYPSPTNCDIGACEASLTTLPILEIDYLRKNNR